MKQIKTTKLIDQMKKLVEVVPEAQKKLDRAYCNDLDKCVRLLAHYGVTHDNPILQSVLPTHLVLSKYEVDVNLFLTCTKEKGVDVAFRLNGKPVHSFLELRYGTSESCRDKIAVTVETVPYFEKQRKDKEK